MNDRRKEDEKFTHLEQIILDVHAKVNNGLSDRTKKTADLLDSLHKEHGELKEMIKVHIDSDLRDNAELIASNKEIASTFKTWAIALYGILFTMIAGLVGISVWLVTHSGEIAAILEHLGTVIGN